MNSDSSPPTEGTPPPAVVKKSLSQEFFDFLKVFGIIGLAVTNLSGSITEFKFGDLISNIIDFLIIAFIVFLAYKQLSKYKLVEDKTKPENK